MVVANEEGRQACRHAGRHTGTQADREGGREKGRERATGSRVRSRGSSRLHRATLAPRRDVSRSGLPGRIQMRPAP